MTSPCHGCMSRHEKCHVDCAKYIAFRERLSETTHKARAKERVMNAFAIQKAERAAKVKQSFQK